jgi:hypothetical protein
MPSCPSGWEPDHFSSNCAIPTEVNVSLGIFILAVVPLNFVPTCYRVHTASRSFSSRDFEVKLAFLLWNLGGLASMWIMAPLAYDRRARLLYKAVFVMFILCITVFVTMFSFRKLRRGFQRAFALSPNIDVIVRTINISLVINVLLLAVLMPFAVFGAMSGEKADRQALLYVFIGIWLVPQTTATAMGLRFSTMALRTLPNTAQSAAIRTAIHKNIKMAKGTFYTQVYAITSPIVVVFFLSDFIWFIVLLNTAITYTLEVCVTSRLSSARLSSTHRTIHALPLDYTAKTLRELEADGRATFSITAPSEAQHHQRHSSLHRRCSHRHGETRSSRAAERQDRKTSSSKIPLLVCRSHACRCLHRRTISLQA